MANMDEMEKAIRKRSESLGFRFVVLLLASWSAAELALYLFGGRSYNSLPTLVLMGALLVQGFSELSMKRRMVEGDEEYREPSNIVKAVVAVIGVTVVVFFVGFFALKLS
ncbi:MAG: hypothetical protein RR178_08810 [Gordonibacter sp.]